MFLQNTGIHLDCVVSQMEKNHILKAKKCFGTTQEVVQTTTTCSLLYQGHMSHLQATVMRHQNG